MPSISGKYAGECRKGLAHGQGTSQGTDLYLAPVVMVGNKTYSRVAHDDVRNILKEYE